MRSEAFRSALQIFLLASAVFAILAAQTLHVTPDRGTEFKVSRVAGSKCTVCTGRRQCYSSVVLKDTGTASVDFTCSKPQDEFSVEILRNIECTTRSCSGNIVQTESGSVPLVHFNRTFTWNLQASRPRAFKLDFAGTPLRQINPTQSCPDQHTYTLQSSQSTGPVAIGTYCTGGTISGVQVLNDGTFSLHLPAKKKLQAAHFRVSVGEEIKSLAKIKLTIPEGTSSSELLSPNYPETFPDDDLIEWEFQVPPKHNTTVSFLRHTLPHCLKKESRVEYQSRGRGALVLKLTDTQPDKTQGNFSLTLRNCEMDRTRTGSSGLSLRFSVSAIRASLPVLCRVDLRRERGLFLDIEKVRPGSACELKMNSVTQGKITVPSDSVAQLSFQDCPPQDVHVTARRVLECRQLRDCPKAPVSLAVPVLPKCLPAPLSSVTWTLRPPAGGSVELLSPAGSLRQCLPGQPCNNSVVLTVAEGDGTHLGRFCSQGAIQKVQIHTNVSVTASGLGGKEGQPSSQSQALLSVSFRGEISDRYIFTVSPKKGAPLLLATPGWPAGMKFYSTVSWIVNVPAKYKAHLMFTNMSLPKCNTRHTNIKVQTLGSAEERYSRREDEEAKDDHMVFASFYLNMSNCMPEAGQFSVVTRITLHKNLLLTIILSVVAVLLVLMITVLTVVCVVIKKKKREMIQQEAIYNPNGASFLPGQNGFPPEDDAHVYSTIEDTLVYTHLLRRGEEMGVYGEADTYQAFVGHTDPPGPPLSLGAADAGGKRPEVSVYQPFVPQQAPPLPNRPPSQGKLMVDNELYGMEIRGEVDGSPGPAGGDQEQGARRSLREENEESEESEERMEPEGGEGGPEGGE